MGLDVRPLTTAGGGYAGVRVEWRPVEPDAVRGTVVEKDRNGRRVRFFVANDVDLIQAWHRQGLFYEQEELAIIGRHYAGGTFVDVGANVGNHSLFALLEWGAPRVVAFEPMPEAARILEINVALNHGQDRFVLHRAGLSNEPGAASAVVPMNNNLGATRMSSAAAGSIRLLRGDDALAQEQPRFIKIDTEGFEIEVLEGLRDTIERHRPTLFVEVENANLVRFDALLSRYRYRIAERYQRYSVNTNFLIVPA